jgi:DNA-binding SARP family transcriptional activator/pimeloyl-ACP methyl ester carboxylesterase
MAGIRLTLFGGFTALGPDGKPVGLSARKCEALLAILACRGGERQSRERLISLLWGDRSDRQARHSLSQAMSLIRGAFGADHKLIVVDREALAIAEGALAADAVDFVRLAEREDIEGLRAAAELYRGPLLDGFRLSEPAFEDWLTQERARFHNLAAFVLMELAEREAAAGDIAAALDHARRALALDPLAEEAHRRLMRLHLDHGNFNAVARQYRECCDVLRSELASIPEPATTAIHQEARARLKQTTQPAISVATATTVSDPERDGEQEIRFCVTSDHVRIAFASAGEGPPLVKTANWLNHLEFDWKSPVWRHLLRALSADFRLIRYDERGNGLSDWGVDVFCLEALVRDLETVVDAAGLDRFPLLGISQGCAVAISYAVRHPERVTRLILHGGYARGWRKRADPAEIARREALRTLVLQGWGQDNPAFRQVFTSFYIPEGNAEQVRWWNDLQRISTSPQNAVRLMDDLGEIDVTPLLARVGVPTLVLHSRRDAAVPFISGRELAAAIPGARFVPLDSQNHVILEQEPAWPRFLEAIRGFLQADDADRFAIDPFGLGPVPARRLA